MPVEVDRLVTDQVIVVTGAGSGIGRASAIGLAERGARVVLADRAGDAVRTLAGTLLANSLRAAPIEVDIGARADVDGLASEVLATHGRIDGLVHCAAISIRGGPLDTSDEAWDDVLRVNLDASFWLGRSFGRVMTEQRSGTMVFLTSDRGLLGSAEAIGYAASKGGLIALVKSLALAYAEFGVTVNGINPGTTDTPLARGELTPEEWQARTARDPLGRVSMPEDVAEIVAFLCGPARSFMTGQIVTTRIR